MAQYTLAPAAVRDLDSILDYISRNNQRAATRTIVRIEQICQRLGEWPLLGTICEHMAEGLRRFTHGSYVIYYRIQPDGVEIVRVVHGARDRDTPF